MTDARLATFFLEVIDKLDQIKSSMDVKGIEDSVERKADLRSDGLVTYIPLIEKVLDIGSTVISFTAPKQVPKKGVRV